MKREIFHWKGRFCFICGIQEVATDVFFCSIFCMSNLLSHGGPPPKRYYIRCFARAWRDLGSSPGSYLSLLQCPVLSLLASSHPPLVPLPQSWNCLSAWWNGGSWWGLLACFAFFFFSISSLNLLCRLDLSRLGAKRTAAASSVTKFCGLFLHHSCRPPSLHPCSGSAAPSALMADGHQSPLTIPPVASYIPVWALCPPV